MNGCIGQVSKMSINRNSEASQSSSTTAAWVIT
jgi:hypothetical protein